MADLLHNPFSFLWMVIYIVYHVNAEWLLTSIFMKSLRCLKASELAYSQFIFALWLILNNNQYYKCFREVSILDNALSTIRSLTYSRSHAHQIFYG